MRMNRFFLFGIALDVALNLALIPQWHALGSAIAAICTQVFIAGAMIWLAVEEFGFRPSKQGMLQVLGFAQFILLFDAILFNMLDAPWGLKFALALAIGLAALFAFQLVDFKKIREAL